MGRASFGSYRVCADRVAVKQKGLQFTLPQRSFTRRLVSEYHNIVFKSSVNTSTVASDVSLDEV
jgi:hypothetical protein